MQEKGNNSINVRIEFQGIYYAPEILSVLEGLSKLRKNKYISANEICHNTQVLIETEERKKFDRLCVLNMSLWLLKEIGLVSHKQEKNGEMYIETFALADKSC
ncbi:MAG: hypothetical protein Q8P80_04240 [Candidatus Levybacteria bacterium]|nr:hypothetical protein [Candidatus Levybacteria bacterium]